MACATAKRDGSSRYANSIRDRSTRLAGSVRERAIAPNSAKSFSPIANSIACRHAVMSSTLSANQSRKPRTHVGKCESSTYDGFHGIDVLVGSIRIYLVSAGQIERRLGADDPQSSAFTERELSAERAGAACLSEDIAMIWERPSDRAAILATRSERPPRTGAARSGVGLSSCWS